MKANQRKLKSGLSTFLKKSNDFGEEVTLMGNTLLKVIVSIVIFIAIVSIKAI